MRTRVLLFLALVLAGLFAVPAANTVAQWRSGAWSLESASPFNLDVPAGWLNRALYAFGISAAPKDVVIGREGWLYLGDDHESTRTVTRRSADAADRARAQEVAQASRAWEAWLRARGVRVYRTVVLPNKESVCPEFLPRWAVPAEAGVTDAVVAAAARTHVDLRPALRAARAAHPHALYYRTDTHWNALGAALAFEAFGKQLAPLAPELRWPGPQASEVLSLQTRGGGDLAKLLRLERTLVDLEPVTRTSASPAAPEAFDLWSRARLRPGAEGAAYLRRPVLVVSPGALNPVRVLWLRDSFGDAMRPSMAATFSHAVHFSWARALASPQALAQIVEAWRPDYVFVTVVERHAHGRAFTSTPPGPVDR